MPVQYGGFWIRLGASLLDALILAPAILLEIWLGRLDPRFIYFTGTLNVALGVFIWVYCVKRWGGSPGMLICGLRIVSISLAPAGWREASLRYSVLFVLSLLVTLTYFYSLSRIPIAEYSALSPGAQSQRIIEYGGRARTVVAYLRNIWVWSEFLVLLTNSKRRALPDFIAGTLVISLNGKSSQSSRPKTTYKMPIALSIVAFGLFAAVLLVWSKLPPRRSQPIDNSSPAAVSADAALHGGHGVLRPTIADLAYASKSPFEKLDLYLPTRGSGPVPLVIWIHGGGFSVGDKQSMPRRDFGPAPKPTGMWGPYQIQVPDVAALTAKGYAVVSLNYRLGFTMFTGALSAVQDGKAAIRFLRANAAKYGLDSSKFAVWGNSSGGYMAAILGVTGDQATIFDDPSLGNAGVSSAVQAVVVWYGAEDRLPGPTLSIVHYLPNAKVLPPFRIVNGDADQVISPAQARRLNEALTAAGAISTLTILPGAGHEDPAYMATQMIPTFGFLDMVIGQKR